MVKSAEQDERNFFRRYIFDYNSKMMRAFRRLIKGFLCLYIPLMVGCYLVNNYLVSSKNGTAAVLLSSYAFDYTLFARDVQSYKKLEKFNGKDHWSPPLAFLGSYPAWSLYFSWRKQRLDYFFSATVDDFETVLTDPKYQSIVFVGHGSFNSIQLADGQVDNDFVTQRLGKSEKKSGEWFQLSCPAFDYRDQHIGSLVMEQGRFFHYNPEISEDAGTLHFVVDALTGFLLLKQHTTSFYQLGNQVQRDKR